MAFPAAAGFGEAARAPVGDAPELGKLAEVTKRRKTGTETEKDATKTAATPALGSYTTVEGLRRSARLAQLTVEAASEVSEPIQKLLDTASEFITSPTPPPEETAPVAGSGRRMRGGDRRTISILATVTIIAGAAYLKGSLSVAAVGGAGGAVALLSALLGESRMSVAREKLGAYLEEKGAARLVDSLGKAGRSTVGLGDKALGLVFATLRIPVAATTLAVGTVAELAQRGTAAVGKAADYMETPTASAEQADLIIAHGTLAFTAALAALTVSGAIPIMTILSVILWVGKLYATPVGRAIAIVELYLWWINQSDAGKKATTEQVKAFVAETKKGGKVAAKWIGDNAGKMNEAAAYVAAKLGPAGAGFAGGFKEGIEHPENPLIMGLSLGLTRAVGLAFDDKAPPPTAGVEDKNALELLAENILKTAFAGGRVHPAKLKNAITKLKEINEAARRVEEIKKELAGAETAYDGALKAVGGTERNAAGPPVVLGARAAAGDGAGPAAPSPAAAAGDGDGGAAAAGPGAAARRRGAAGPGAVPGGPPAAAAAAGDGDGGAGAAAPRRGERRPRAGGARKTRRKRFARRKTKKTISSFYY